MPSLLSRKWRLRWGVAALVVAALSGCPGPRDGGRIEVVVTDNGNAATTPESLDDIVELAKREGELWWYTSLPEEPAREFLRLFEQKHPYITAHLVRESTFDTIRCVEAEFEEGRVRADVLHVLDVAVFVKLRKQGQLLEYSSPQERFVPPQYKDPGHWSALRCVGLCIAYDPKRVAEAEAPSSWDGLIEGRWEGRVGLKDAQTAGSAYAHYYFLREEYGVSYWQRMAAQRPRVVKTAAENLAALASGEVDIISGAMGYSVYDAQRKGASVKEVWPSDGVPMMIGPIAILSAAPHRNAARLFMDFSLSKEGQTALRDRLGAYSVRDDVPPPPGRSRLSEMNIMTPGAGWGEYAQKQDTLKAEYMGLFHPDAE